MPASINHFSLCVQPTAVRPDTWRLEAQGSLLALAKRQGYPAVPPGTKRGAVQGFSRGSRMRLLKTINRIDWKALRRCVFLHLTYPDDCWERSLGLVPRHLDLIQKRMEYHLGRDVSFLWKVEWKNRLTGCREGQLAPHIHLLPMMVHYYPIQKLVQQWTEVIEAKEIPNVELTRRDKAEYAAMYAAKYAAKADEDGLGLCTYSEKPVGRPWGLTNRPLVPFCKRAYAPEITEAMADAARDAYGQERGEVPVGGYTLFVKDASKIYKRIIRTGFRGVDAGRASG